MVRPPGATSLVFHLSSLATLLKISNASLIKHWDFVTNLPWADLWPSITEESPWRGEYSTSSAHFYSFGQHPLPPRSSKHTSMFPLSPLPANKQRGKTSLKVFKAVAGNQELHLSPDRVDITSSYAKPTHRWLITTFSLFTKPSSSFALSFFFKKLGFAPKILWHNHPRWLPSRRTWCLQLHSLRLETSSLLPIRLLAFFPF